MIRPVHFGFNAETAVNNAFQVAGADAAAQEKAEREFDEFVHLLRQNGVNVLVVNDTPEPHTPDSIFPNNWISFHDEGAAVLYPMFAANRRAERKPQVLEALKEQFNIKETIDLSDYENKDLFLEGTGSMVLDRDHKIAYACLSPRTHKEVLNEFCKKMQYKPILFTAIDASGKPVYHTNVMMCVADRYAVICLESIASQPERELVAATLHQSGKEIIDISMEQMNRFAGNMLQVQNNKGEKILVMSGQAYASLTEKQLNKLSSLNRIVYAPLNTIETNGGGSARCMMAEIFLEIKNKK